MMRIASSLCAAVVVTLSFSGSLAGVIRVPADQATLQEGIDAVADGDTVLVAPGTYSGALNRDLSIEDRNLTLLSETGPASTTIDCGGASRAITISVTTQRSSVVVSGFTFINGDALHGGAVQAAGAGPTIIENCVFRDNTSEADGGAVSCGSGVTIRGSMFVNNFSHEGGAIMCRASSPHIADCIFIGNSATMRGGAIGIWSVSGSGPWLTSCRFEGNSSRRGGTIGITSSISRPEAEGDLGRYESSSRGYDFQECEFIGNWATEKGGAVYTQDFDGCGGPHMMRCTFADNESPEGGAVYVENGYDTFIWWCVFTRNVATTGGAVFMDNSGFVLGCTFYENTADVGAALSLSHYSPPPHDELVGVAYSIVLGNLGGPAVDCGLGKLGCARCISYANEGGDSLCQGEYVNWYADPLLCGPEGGNLAPCSDSPCLPESNPWGELIGALDEGCGPCATAVQERTWGAIKARFR